MGGPGRGIYWSVRVVTIQSRTTSKHWRDIGHATQLYMYDHSRCRHVAVRHRHTVRVRRRAHSTAHGRRHRQIQLGVCVHSHTAYQIELSYSTPYRTYFGGVTAFTDVQYCRCNGMSNKYWGWGGEDDDMLERYCAHTDVSLTCMYSVRATNQSSYRLPVQLGRYVMAVHSRDVGNEENANRHVLLKETVNTWRSDGLNNVVYTVLRYKQWPTYTEIHVQLSDA